MSCSLYWAVMVGRSSVCSWELQCLWVEVCSAWPVVSVATCQMLWKDQPRCHGSGTQVPSEIFRLAKFHQAMFSSTIDLGIVQSIKQKHYAIQFLGSRAECTQQHEKIGEWLLFCSGSASGLDRMVCGCQYQHLNQCGVAIKLKQTSC